MVKPYSTAELEDYRKKLIALRNQMHGDVSSITETAMRKNRIDESPVSGASPIHLADAGSDNFEQEFTLSLMEAGAETLQKIKEAIRRIDDGTYGVCEDCGAKIPKKRLEAIPYASKCVKCVQNN